MNTVQTLFLFVVLTLTGWQLNAQQINIQVLVPTSPPPSSLAEIIAFESEVIIVLSNTSSQVREIKLVASLNDLSRGHNLTMKRGIPGLTPITLTPGQVREVRFRELRSLYGNLSANDFIIDGFEFDQIVREEHLPEGTYSICIEALDFNTDELLSMEGNCGFFPIIAYDPPIIIFPEQEATLVSTTPQNIIFNWTPTGLPQNTRYRFQLVNTEDYQFANPFDVFNYQGEVFTYQQNELITTFFHYDISRPPLQEGATYALRVQAYDDDNELNYVNDGWSEPVVFTYTPQGGGIEPVGTTFETEPTAPNLSVSDCVTYGDAISTNFNTSVTAGQTIAVGAFMMVTDQISLNAGAQTYSGSGTIYVDFLQQDLAVQFESIRVNNNMRMYGELSLVYATNENNSIVAENISNSYNTPLVFGFPNGFQSYLNNHQSPAATMGVPFRVGGTEAVVSAIVFTPERSKAKIGIPIPYPNTSANADPYIPYYNNDVCITPDGYLDDQLVFGLSSDLELPFQNNLAELSLPQTGNMLVLNANGDMTFDFNAELIFDRSIVRYQSSLQDVSFLIEENGLTSLNALLTANLALNERVVYPALNDLSLNINQALLDFSDQSNHAQFNNKYPGETALWQGIYCPDINVRLPSGLGGDAVGFDVGGLALSGNGLSLKFNRQSNIIGIGSGRLAQWPFSISSFQLDIQDGALNSGSFDGKLRLPIQQSGGIDYTATISSTNNQLDLDLTASTASDFTVPMWKANFDIFEGSSIGLDRVGGNYRLLAHLNGRISIDFENPAATGTLSQLNIPSLTFEDFVIEGRDLPGFIPQLNFSFIELENPNNRQLSFEFFDFTLQDVSVRNPAGQPNRYGLELDLGLSLFGGDVLSGPFGAGVSTKLTVWARYQDGFSYDRIVLDEIQGEMDLGIAEANVTINLFNRHAIFGNGFKGDADIALKTSGAAFGAGFSIQFGKVDNYRYWYFDGYYKNEIAPGIALGPSGVSIYGFGGGGYYNMQVNQSITGSPITYNELSGSAAADPSDPTSTHSGFEFTPQNNNSGFLANSIIGSTVSPSAWNVNSKFLMDFNRHPNFAINSVQFAGKLRMMKALSDNSLPDFNLTTTSETAFQLLVQRQNQSRTIHASLHHQLGGLFSSVNIPVDFHTTYNMAQDTRNWYLHIGRWSQADPFSDDSRISIFRGIDTPVFKAGMDIRAYMMLGNHFPPPTYAGLPPLPSYITNQSDDAGNTGVNRNNDDAATVLNAMDSRFSSSFGIGLGVGVKAGFSLGDDIPIFYADMSAEVVVDGLLSKTLGCADGSSLGFNDWYLQGQAYAYVHGEVGARVRFLGRTIRKSLVNLYAGALLQAELPNPSWLKGKVFIGGEILGGRIRFKPRPVGFEFGDRCEQIQGGDEHPFAEFDYIGEFIPGDGKKDVSVFVDPRVTFNLNDGEVFEVMDVEGNTHTYRVNFDYFLKESGSTRGVSMQEIHWNENRSALRLTPSDWLEEHTWYEFSILIRGYEYTNGSWRNPIYERTETSSFKTGSRPTQFVLEDIISSYPGFRQRYFMTRTDGGERAEGWLQMDKTICDEILGANQAANIEEGNIIRFTNIRTRTFTETPCWCKNDKTLAFDFPAGRLSREEIYRINIGFREKEGYFTANTATLDETESTYASTNTLTLDASDPGQYEQLQNEYTDKSDFVNKFKYINLLDPAAQWYAQTSRFESYAQKLSSFSVAQTVYIPRMISYSYDVDLAPFGFIEQSGAFGKTFQVPVILLDPGGISEPFDHFDIVGYRHPLAQGGRVDPILNPFYDLSYFSSSKMVNLRADQYFKNLQNEQLREVIEEITAGSPIHRPNSYPFFYEPTRYGPLKRWMQRYNNLVSDLQAAGHNITIQRPAHPLSDNEINRFIDGASDQVGTGSLGLLPDPTHGGNSGSTTTYGVYTPPTPPTGSSSFQMMDEPSDVDFDPGFDVQSNFTSYYALVDWTPRVIHQDRKRANLHAVEQAQEALRLHNYIRYFQALDLLDQKFEDLQLPLGNYQIKLVNELDKTFRIFPYQVNQQ